MRVYGELNAAAWLSNLYVACESFYNFKSKVYANEGDKYARRATYLTALCCSITAIVVDHVKSIAGMWHWMLFEMMRKSDMKDAMIYNHPAEIMSHYTHAQPDGGKCLGRNTAKSSH